jgi:hypothetical protein
MTNCGNPDRNWVTYCTDHVGRIAATSNGQPPDAVMIPRRRANVCTGCRPLLVPVERSPLGHDSATGRLTAINIVSCSGWEDTSLWQPNKNGTA